MPISTSTPCWPNDSAEFGIIRLIVTDPELAVQELKKAGYQCHMDRVVAVEMGDTPGCLDKILDHLCQANVAIDYLYISYNRQTATPVAIFKTGKMENGNVSAGQWATISLEYILKKSHPRETFFVGNTDSIIRRPCRK